MPTAKFQPSFAAGVIGPALHGRIDLQKYDTGLKRGKNVFVHVQGGVSNRAGTQFICEVPDSTKAHRLLPFRRDSDENYVMVMGDRTMRIIDHGEVLQDGGGDYAPTTPYATADLDGIDFVQSIDVMFFAHEDYAPQKMSRSAATAWTFADLELDPTLTTPIAPIVTAAVNDAPVDETYSYKVAPVVAGVEGFASLAGSGTGDPLDTEGQKYTVSWTSTGADEYRVYRERNSIFGYIGFTDGLTFSDDNIDIDLTSTPVVASDVLNAASDYPRKVTMFQQRLVFGSSINQPETLWMSRVGDFENFTKSRVLQDDDRIELDITGSEINTIQSMSQLREMLVFSSSGEFSVTGPNGLLLATNPVQTQHGYAGSTALKPLTVDDTLMFTDRTGRTVRDLKYSFEDDGFSGNDLTIFASHLFDDSRIASWAYAKNPHSVIWVTLEDGTLLSMTYRREHQVWAWTEHDVGGLVEDVVSITEGDEDAVYFLVKRTIDGNTKRYIERLHTRKMADITEAFFVDCGITYDGAAATVITGLDHLEGETVTGVADGSVISPLVVSSGQVTLPYPASKVHIGLGFDAVIENLPPAVDIAESGSSRGRPHALSRLSLQLMETRGCVVGPTDDRLAPLLQSRADLSVAAGLFTGMETITLYPDWNRDGTIVVKQAEPLPMTILGLNPEMTVGR